MRFPEGSRRGEHSVFASTTRSAAPALPGARSVPENKSAPAKKDKRSLSKRVKFALAGTAVATVLGAGSFGAYETIPQVRNAIESIIGSEQNPPEFDIGKLDTQKQAVVLGQNAREATDEEIGNVISSIVPDPESVDKLSTRSVLPSIDLQKAGKVEVWRSPAAFSSIPANLHFSIEKSGARFGLRFEGTGTENAEIFKMQNGAYVGKFDLGNNRYIIIVIDSANLAPTDAIKEATPINNNFLQEAVAKKGLGIDIAKNPEIFTTSRQDSEITIIASFVDGPKGFIEPLIPAVKDGALLFSTPR